MAAMGAVSNAPMNLSALRPAAGLVEQRSFYCIFFKTRDPQPLMGGQCNTCHIVPTCKMRSRNARAYQKKTPEKKAAGKHLSPLDPENASIEVGKEASEQGAVEIEKSNLPEDVKSASIGNTDEKVAIMSSHLAENASVKDDDQKLQDVDSGAALTSLSVGGGTDQESFIDIVEELMHKVKDAERNILMLNEVRMQNLEQLEQMRRETERQLGQINILEVQLAEAEAKLKLASQEKIKLKLLEEEIEVLKAKISENSDVQAQISQQTAQYDRLSEHAKSLQVKMEHMDEVEANLEQLRTENQALQDELRMLQSELAHAANQNALVEQLLTDKKSLENLVSDLETKLAAADTSLQELARLKTEKQTILEKLGKFETDIPSLGTIMLNTVEDNVLQIKAGDLQAALSRVEAENNLLEQAQAENRVLREQIKMLEQRLVDSDAEITSQLELYQAEVESFKASLEQLKLEKDASNAVDDMPWEFWSQILLSIDGWLLEKKLLPGDATALREMAWQRDRSIKEVFVSVRGAPDDSIISALLHLLKSNKRPGMHIVHIAAEMAPVAKVGGLGDVVTGLGKSFQRRGHLVEVILPKYDCMDYSQMSNLKVLNMDLNSHFDGHTFKNKVWVGTVEGLPVYFIEPHHPANFFWRGQVYGENDDFRRFTYFSRAALEFILQSSKKPDIIHCHDWHTAAVAPMYWDLYVPQGLDSARIAFTCHNFEYQGTENPGALASCGLDPQCLHRPDRMQDDFLHNRINLLKGGIIFSNIVTTVSPTYAQEVQGPEGGKGLHIALMAHAHKFFGILNGIDNEIWNPASDLLISHQYSAEEISGRDYNKAALRARLLLSSVGADAKKPIVGCITRLVPQKGVHLIRHAIFHTLEQGGQFILLGSSPIPHIQREFENLSNQFHHHPHIRLILKYDESLSHSIYAGADIFIIPSIFEPCGLTQMIAMRYGAIPVARRTGGLNDSVFDVDDETIPLQRRNGFTFLVPTEEGLNSALDRALRYYVERSEWWIELVRKVMQMDFSWNTSADQYYELYERALARARGP